MSSVTFKKVVPNPEGCSDVEPAEVRELAAQLKLIDVRRPDEFTGELGHIQGATLSTLETTFGADVAQLPRDQAYVFVCRSGARSARAAAYAQSLGLTNVYNMSGGMMAWNRLGFDVVR